MTMRVPKKQEPVVYITPPDEGGVTDNDSADENEDGGFDVSKVGWKTLQGEAEVVIYGNHTSVNEQETGLMQASPVQPVEKDIQDITEKTQTVTPKRLRATSNRKRSGTSKTLDDSTEVPGTSKSVDESTDASSKYLEHPGKRKQTCLSATKSNILPSTKTAQITTTSDKRKILSAPNSTTPALSPPPAQATISKPRAKQWKRSDLASITPYRSNYENMEVPDPPKWLENENLTPTDVFTKLFGNNFERVLEETQQYANTHGNTDSWNSQSRYDSRCSNMK